MKPREFNGEYQLRSGFEEFNESKMCGNIKRKRNSFEPKQEKSLGMEIF